MLKMGDVVTIKYYPYNPDFWDDDHVMEKLMGKTAIIAEYCGRAEYKIHGHSWLWREEDLIPLGANESSDPNIIFKFKKENR